MKEPELLQYSAEAFTYTLNAQPRTGQPLALEREGRENWCQVALSSQKTYNTHGRGRATV